MKQPFVYYTEDPADENVQPLSVRELIQMLSKIEDQDRLVSTTNGFIVEVTTEKIEDLSGYMHDCVCLRRIV